MQVNSAPSERLNRFLARRGVASRRSADAIIEAGRVKVNGRRAVLGTVVRPDEDAITVDGHEVGDRSADVTIALNKPRGVVSTRRDPQHRPTVMQLVERVPGLVPIGRLDSDTRGLLLLTTDGELAHRVAHPRFGVLKRYAVRVDRRPSDTELRRLVDGVKLDDGVARAVRATRGAHTDEIDVVMGEGRRREVRRMFAALGFEVVDLCRVAVGPVELHGLPEGAARRLEGSEAGRLRQAVGLNAPREYNAERLVTVDGPAGSGKSTLGRQLALALHLPFVDTGLFYRAVTALAHDKGIGAEEQSRLGALAEGAHIDVDTDPASTRGKVLVNGRDMTELLFDPSLAQLLSSVSAVRQVRRALLAPQRALARNGAVAAGRDCGTVVFPDARVKLYLQAPDRVRIERRARQVRARGVTPDDIVLRQEVTGRDTADASRSAAPMQPAADAHIIDTERAGVDEMIRIGLEICERAGIRAT